MANGRNSDRLDNGNYGLDVVVDRAGKTHQSHSGEMPQMQDMQRSQM